MTLPQRVAQVLSGRVPAIEAPETFSWEKDRWVVRIWVCPSCGSRQDAFVTRQVIPDGVRLLLPYVVACSLCDRQFVLYDPEKDQENSLCVIPKKPRID